MKHLVQRCILYALYIWDAIQHVPSRAQELYELRKRFIQLPASPKLNAHATQIKQLKLEYYACMGAVEACRTCARGAPLPSGQWEGGFCCGSQTQLLFPDDELQSLRVQGTHILSFQAPKGIHAGCVFRGSTGCSLAPQHRPSQCVVYACRDLSRELGQHRQHKQLLHQYQQIKYLQEHFKAQPSQNKGVETCGSGCDGDL